MAYTMMDLVFVETPTFTRLITQLMPDDDYRKLQQLLIENPARGDVIAGGGGVRKLRFSLPGRGKQGGARVLYYWLDRQFQIYLLVAYKKSVKDDLSASELALLRSFVKEL